MDRTETTNRLSIRLLSCFCWLWAPLALADWIDPIQRPAMQASAFGKALWLDAELDDDRLLMVGAHGLLIESTQLDAPFDWRQTPMPVSVTLTAVTSHPEYRLVVGQDGVILRQNQAPDASQAWTPVLDGFAANRQMLGEIQNALRQNSLNAVDRETLTWIEEDLKQDIQRQSTKPFLDIEILEADSGRLLAIGAYGMAFLSEDKGLTWQSHTLAIDNPDRYHLNRLLPLDNGHWLLVGEQGLLRLSKDQGRRWDSLPLEQEPSSWFAAASLGSTVLVTGIQGHYVFSQDQGVTWKSGFDQALGTPLYATACYSQWFCLFGRRGRIHIAALHADGLKVLGQWQLPQRSDITRAIKRGSGWLLTLSKGFVVWQLPSAKEWLQEHRQPLEVAPTSEVFIEDKQEVEP